ncbi:MAG: fibronectin type III domain-containing protein, partial [Candidatus Marinimicrobia bacterium]|nr:fibronectin type III domain-containing protein [Candidatus Neomarinimicrobiota bacterium]
ADADSVYKVYKHTSAFNIAATYLVGATSAKTSPHETTYTITGLDNATRYYFRVTAVSKLGYEGTASATVDITPKFSGPIWWVATNGNDDTNEGSATSPFNSLDHAMHEANEGDTVKIKPGTYTGSKNRDLDPEGKNLVIMSQYPTTWDSVIIDAQQNGRHFWHKNTNGNADAISASKTKLIGLTLKNGEAGSETNTGHGDAGSVILEGTSSITFEKIYFLNNRIINNSSTSSAGAVYMTHSGSIFYNCRFESNRSIHIGNGDAQATGAIGFNGDASNSNFSSIYTLIDGCEFINNEGRNEGGAINARHSIVIQNSLFYKNKVGENGNGHGGAIAAMPRGQGDGGWAYDTYLHVINCTFVENLSASSGGAISHYGSNPPVIFNSIFLNNYREFDSGNPMLDNFSAGGSGSGNQILIDYSSLVWNDNDNQETNSGSNIYTDIPLFTDTTKENFTLTSASTLIGAGTTSFEGVSAPTKDINGNTRPNPSGSNPDLGAYENSLAESPFPSQVKNVTATITSQSVNLSWDANIETDIEKYLIYMSETSGFEPTKEDSVGEATETVYNVTGLTNNTEYHFRVAAVDSSGYRGSFSQELSATPQYLGPTWWVSNDGNDSSDGSEFLPLNSLFEAFRRVNSGDTIAIKAGTYGGDANAGIIDDQIFLQQDGSPKPSMELTIKGVTGDPRDVVFDGQNNGKQRFFIFQRRDPYNDKIRIENITFQNEFHNGDTNDGASGGGAIAFITAHTELVFENVIFKKNNAHQPDYHGGGGAVMIYVAEGKKPPMFINCDFVENRIQAKDGSGNDNAMGGAVCIQPGWEGPGTDAFNQPAVIFDQCYFESNQAHSSNPTNGRRTGSAIQAMANIIIRNSVFVNNHFSGGNTGEDVTVDLQPQYGDDGQGNRYSGKAILINNTFHNNPGERIISFRSSDHESARLFLYSNIFSEYTGGYEAVQVSKGSTGVEFHAGSNLFDEAGEHYTLHIDIQIIDGGGDVIGDPKFKGEAIKNFELTPSSPAIDAGINSLPPGSNDELGGGNAPIFDIRGYYRVGTPDIGAYEFGAS